MKNKKLQKLYHYLFLVFGVIAILTGVLKLLRGRFDFVDLGLGMLFVFVFFFIRRKA